MEKESLKNEVKFLIGHPYIGSQLKPKIYAKFLSPIAK
jgi:hypothetical protein